MGITYSQSLVNNADKAAFERTIDQLQALVANVGAHLSLDASVRQAYARDIAVMASEMEQQVHLGHLTWKQAAEKANELRNIIMEAMRGRSSPVGRAVAEQMKRNGKPLNTLIARHTLELYGPRAIFTELNAAQKNVVYAAVVKSAGRSRPEVTALIPRFSLAGRSLLVLSIAISAYIVATADDKVGAIKREGAVTAAGIGGGVAGGMLAGLACGPGAPVCVTIGAFVGGAAAALGVSLWW